MVVEAAAREKDNQKVDKIVETEQLRGRRKEYGYRNRHRLADAHAVGPRIIRSTNAQAVTRLAIIVAESVTGGTCAGTLDYRPNE